MAADKAAAAGDQDALVLPELHANEISARRERDLTELVRLKPDTTYQFFSAWPEAWQRVQVRPAEDSWRHCPRGGRTGPRIRDAAPPARQAEARLSGRRPWSWREWRLTWRSAPARPRVRAPVWPAAATRTRK